MTIIYGGGSSAHCRMFNSVSGLCPLDANRNSPVVATKHLLTSVPRWNSRAGKSHPVKNCWSRERDKPAMLYCLVSALMGQQRMFWKHKAEPLSQCMWQGRKVSPEGATFRLALDDWVEVTWTKKGNGGRGQRRMHFEEAVSGALRGLQAQGTCEETKRLGVAGTQGRGEAGGHASGEE